MLMPTWEVAAYEFAPYAVEGTNDMWCAPLHVPVYAYHRVYAAEQPRPLPAYYLKIGRETCLSVNQSDWNHTQLQFPIYVMRRIKHSAEDFSARFTLWSGHRDSNPNQLLGRQRHTLYTISAYHHFEGVLDMVDQFVDSNNMIIWVLSIYNIPSVYCVDTSPILRILRVKIDNLSAILAVRSMVNLTLKCAILSYLGPDILSSPPFAVSDILSDTNLGHFGLGSAGQFVHRSPASFCRKLNWTFRPSDRDRLFGVKNFNMVHHHIRIRFNAEAKVLLGVYFFPIIRSFWANSKRTFRLFALQPNNRSKWYDVAW